MIEESGHAKESDASVEAPSWGKGMSPLLLQSLAPLVVVLGFLRLRADMKRIERKADKLSDEHNGLSRELSEVKGYVTSLQPSPVRG